MLGDGKSVDCRVPNKHSDGDKKFKAVRCPMKEKKKRRKEQKIKVCNYALSV